MTLTSIRYYDNPSIQTLFPYTVWPKNRQGKPTYDSRRFPHQHPAADSFTKTRQEQAEIDAHQICWPLNDNNWFLLIDGNAPQPYVY
jgi:hypothetical protein